MCAAPSHPLPSWEGGEGQEGGEQKHSDRGPPVIYAHANINTRWHRHTDVTDEQGSDTLITDGLYGLNYHGGGMPSSPSTPMINMHSSVER